MLGVSAARNGANAGREEYNMQTLTGAPCGSLVFPSRKFHSHAPTGQIYPIINWRCKDRRASGVNYRRIHGSLISG